MRRPLDRAVLDSMAGHGCMVERCPNQGRHAHVLRLHQRCHPGAPLFMDNTEGGGVIAFRCVRPPFDLVVEVQSKAVRFKDGGGFNVNGTFEQRCHDTSAVIASYQHDSGIVAVSCFHCEKIVSEVEV